jgi:hypothetical protein
MNRRNNRTPQVLYPTVGERSERWSQSQAGSSTPPSRFSHSAWFWRVALALCRVRAPLTQLELLGAIGRFLPSNLLSTFDFQLFNPSPPVSQYSAPTFNHRRSAPDLSTRPINPNSVRSGSFPSDPQAPTSVWDKAPTANTGHDDSPHSNTSSHFQLNNSLN